MLPADRTRGETATHCIRMCISFCLCLILYFVYTRRVVYLYFRFPLKCNFVTLTSCKKVRTVASYACTRVFICICMCHGINQINVSHTLAKRFFFAPHPHVRVAGSTCASGGNMHTIAWRKSANLLAGPNLITSRTHQCTWN